MMGRWCFKHCLCFYVFFSFLSALRNFNADATRFFFFSILCKIVKVWIWGWCRYEKQTSFFFFPVYGRFKTGQKWIYEHDKKKQNKRLIKVLIHFFFFFWINYYTVDFFNTHEYVFERRIKKNKNKKTPRNTIGNPRLYGWKEITIQGPFLKKWKKKIIQIIWY